jgi:hypothetical protein
MNYLTNVWRVLTQTIFRSVASIVFVFLSLSILLSIVPNSPERELWRILIWVPGLFSMLAIAISIGQKLENPKGKQTKSHALNPSQRRETTSQTSNT